MSYMETRRLTASCRNLSPSVFRIVVSLPNRALYWFSRCSFSPLICSSSASKSSFDMSPSPFDVFSDSSGLGDGAGRPLVASSTMARALRAGSSDVDATGEVASSAVVDMSLDAQEAESLTLACCLQAGASVVLRQVQVSDYSVPLARSRDQVRSVVPCETLIRRVSIKGRLPV